MANSGSTHSHLLPHSKVKVELFTRYAYQYISIIGSSGYFDRIYILDLFCGEGMYSDGNTGTPIAAIEAANDALNNMKIKSSLRFWFNDPGRSEVEPDRKKIDRVKEYCENLRDQRIVTKYTDSEFHDILDDALRLASSSSKNKCLFFLDPWGYKYSQPNIVKSIMGTNNSELLLFLPLSQMYRLANKDDLGSGPGQEALAKFLKALYPNGTPRFSSTQDMAVNFNSAFESYLSEYGTWVDHFLLERGNGIWYALFFFTSKAIGFEKMLGVKWSLDTEEGRGFSIAKETLPLFDDPLATSTYPELLYQEIRTTGSMTNRDIYMFGLKHRHLPTHSKRCLNAWIKSKRITRISCDGLPAKGNYISGKSTRIVEFRIAEPI